jgi:hypothetical protein
MIAGGDGSIATLLFKTRILPGGRIVIQSPHLLEGQEVTLQIEYVAEETRPKKTFLENLGDYTGGQLFKTAEEVDRYIKEERESWGD